MMKKAGRWFFVILAFVVNLATLGTIIFQVEDPSTIAIIALTVTSVFAFIFLADSIYLRWKWARRTRYTRAIELLNRGFQEVHELGRLEEQDVTRKQLRETLSRICSSLAHMFSEVTGTKCSVCIKVLSVKKKNGRKVVAYETLCRNQNAGRRRYQADSVTREEEILHTLEDNHAFEIATSSIGTTDERGFMSNGLPLIVKYTNTSFHEDLYGKPHQGVSVILRLFKWPLPYKSTIVVPIHPLHPEATASKVRLSGGKDEDENAVLGFLCVDSTSLRAFRSFDREIMAGTADGMYNTLKEYQDLLVNVQPK